MVDQLGEGSRHGCSLIGVRRQENNGPLLAPDSSVAEVQVDAGAGELVELFDLGDEVDGDVRVELDVAGDLGQARDSLLDRRRQLFEAVAGDDVGRGSRVGRPGDHAAPSVLDALVVNDEAEPAGPVAVVRVPVLVSHRAVLVAPLLVDEPRAVAASPISVRAYFGATGTGGRRRRRHRGDGQVRA
jgi:hypothetical protein